MPPRSIGARIPPATGSIKIYSIAYKRAVMVPRFGGKDLIRSHSGNGISDGVLVA